GIRDLIVTGVQTCALPIYILDREDRIAAHRLEAIARMTHRSFAALCGIALFIDFRLGAERRAISEIGDNESKKNERPSFKHLSRSEERRVGKECRWRWNR